MSIYLSSFCCGYVLVVKVCFNRKSMTMKKESRGEIEKNMSMVYKKKLTVLIVDDDPSCRTLHM